MLGGRMGSVSGARIADGDAASQFVDTLSGLSSGVVQIAVSGGVATPSTFVATAGRIPFGSGTNGGLTDDSALNFSSTTKNLRVGTTADPETSTSSGLRIQGKAIFGTAAFENPVVTSAPIQLYVAGNAFLIVRDSTNHVEMAFGNAGTTGFIGTQTNHQVSLATNNNAGLTLTTDRRLYGSSLHNNGGSVTGTSNQYIASGTYTPTLTGVTNVAASTARKCQWIRVGNVVTVSGSCDIDPTAAAATALGISLPIASNLALATDLGGAAAADGAVAIEAAAVRGDATNDRAEVSYIAVGIANHTIYFSFQYEVL